MSVNTRLRGALDALFGPSIKPHRSPGKTLAEAVDDLTKVVSARPSTQDLQRVRSRLDKMEIWAWGKPRDPVVYCSFCGKSENDVRELVAGATGHICEECIGICRKIVEDDQR